jgi:hypothetical protein
MSSTQERPDNLQNGLLDIKPIETQKHKIKQNQLMKKNIIPRHPSSVIFNGTSGSGKSTLLCNFLTKPQFFAKYFKKKNIYLISPTGASDDLFENLNLDDENIIVDINRDAQAKLREIMDDQKEVIDSEGIDKAEKVLIIFEDIQSNSRFMRSSEFLKCFLMQRHYGLSVWLCGQSFKLTPRSCRMQANNIFCFQPNGSEMEVIVESYCPPGASKKDFEALVSHATADDYSFLHINRRVPFKDRYRKNLSTILRFG